MAAWQCAAVFAVIVPVVVMACVLQMPVPLPAPLLLLNITIAVSPITVLIAILRPGRSNRGQHRSESPCRHPSIPTPLTAFAAPCSP